MSKLKKVYEVKFRMKDEEPTLYSRRVKAINESTAKSKLKRDFRNDEGSEVFIVEAKFIQYSG